MRVWYPVDSWITPPFGTQPPQVDRYSSPKNSWMYSGCAAVVFMCSLVNISLSIMLYVCIFHGRYIERTVGRVLASITSRYLHWIYSLTASKHVLSCEFRIALWVRNHESKIFVTILTIFIFSTAFLIHYGLLSMYRHRLDHTAIAFITFITTTMPLIASRIRPIFQRICLRILRTYAVHLIVSCFKLHRELYEIELKQKMQSHGQTLAVLNTKNKKVKMALPLVLNQVIANYLYHGSVQQLYLENLVVGLLRNEVGDDDDDILHEIIEYAFGHREFHCFHVNYCGDPTIGYFTGQILRQCPNILNKVGLKVSFGVDFGDDDDTCKCKASDFGRYSVTHFQ